MKCPYCGAENTRVIDSRPVEESNSIRRRRQCDECDKRFTTSEKVETIPLVVIKKGNVRQLVDEVETEIFSMEEKEIPSYRIGELVMDKLKKLDEVAYVRFASVYREFKDVNTFMDELKTLLDHEG